MVVNKVLRSNLFAIITVFCWGTSYIISKTLLQSMTAFQLIWLRFIAAYITMWILHPKWHFNLKEEGLFLVIAIFSNTLYFICENSALKYTQSSNVSILASTIPLITALLLFVFKGRKIRGLELLGCIIAFLGVILVVFNGVFYLKLSPKGDLLAIGAALSWSVYSLMMTDRIRQYNNFLVTRKLMFYGIITMTPIVGFAGGFGNITAGLTGGNIIRILYLAVVCSALCYLMWNTAMRDLGVMTLNIYLYAMPVITLAAGAIVLGEKITFMGTAGMIIVIAGMILSSLVTEKKEKRKKQK